MNLPLKSHTITAILAAAARGERVYLLDTASAGEDDTLLGAGVEEVWADITHHHEATREELEERGWTLREISVPRPGPGRPAVAAESRRVTATVPTGLLSRAEALTRTGTAATVRAALEGMVAHGRQESLGNEVIYPTEIRWLRMSDDNWHTDDEAAGASPGPQEYGRYDDGGSEGPRWFPLVPVVDEDLSFAALISEAIESGDPAAACEAAAEWLSEEYGLTLDTDLSEEDGLTVLLQPANSSVSIRISRALWEEMNDDDDVDRGVEIIVDRDGVRWA